MASKTQDTLKGAVSTGRGIRWNGHRARASPRTTTRRRPAAGPPTRGAAATSVRASTTARTPWGAIAISRATGGTGVVFGIPWCTVRGRWCVPRAAPRRRTVRSMAGIARCIRCVRAILQGWGLGRERRQ
eukprot:16433851-Heterocapsa_arctica.AAC.1